MEAPTATATPVAAPRAAKALVAAGGRSQMVLLRFGAPPRFGPCLLAAARVFGQRPAREVKFHREELARSDERDDVQHGADSPGRGKFL